MVRNIHDIYPPSRLRARLKHAPISKKTWIYGIATFVWLAWISGVFGNSGIIQAYRLSQVRRDMTLRIKALENEKSKLQANLKALEQDSYTQESTIRESLGFVRENEVVFEFR